jgi:hypothetical protein
MEVKLSNGNFTVATTKSGSLHQFKLSKDSKYLSSPKYLSYSKDSKDSRDSKGRSLMWLHNSPQSITLITESFQF